MIVKTICADGTIEMFDTKEYKISRVKDFHPLICSVTIYENGKKILTRKRRFSWWYKHFVFWKPEVQEQLRKIMKQEQ